MALTELQHVQIRRLGLKECSDCGAMVKDETKHRNWHQKLNDRFKAHAKGAGY